ncbi:MAG: S8 family serine peptidase [Planctomycetaceae bacterium]
MLLTFDPNWAAFGLEPASNFDDWAVTFSKSTSVSKIKKNIDYDSVKRFDGLPNTFLVDFAGEVTVDEASDQLLAIKNAVEVSPNVVIEPEKFFVPNDPLFADQWHLQHTGQNGGAVGTDANVVPAWDIVLGTQSVIGIIDDGLQGDHPDLAANYRSDLSFDYFEGDSDPSPGFASDNHGTSVGGVSAAVGNNQLGVSGAAPEAGLAGLRLISGGISAGQIAGALSHASDRIDIYNNSWGSGLSGALAPSSQLVLSTIENAAQNGRDGLGNVYIFSAGNSRANAGNVNYRALQNSRHTIAVGSIADTGVRSGYSEIGASLFVSAPSNGGRAGITTTDRTGADGYDNGSDYTDTFGGTSSAAPLVAGVVGLILDANPSLTSRDVNHIIASTSQQIDENNPDWVVNGGGFHHSHEYGFGMIDAAAAVEAAIGHTPVPDEIVFSTRNQSVGTPIPDDNASGASFTITVDELIQTEYIDVTLNATHDSRDDLEITLTSPDGTVSVLAENRNTDNTADYNWTFTTARHWGELTEGDWTVTLRDLTAGDTGVFESVELEFFGFDPDLPAPDAPRILSPVGEIGDLTPIVSWTQEEFASTYDLQVEDLVTNELIVDETGITETNSRITDRLKEQRYQSRVRAINFEGDQSEWSAWTEFEVDIARPGVPEPVSPRGLTTTRQPTFEWLAADRAVSYDLMVSLSDTGKVVINRSGLTGLEYTHFLPLSESEYDWKVRAVNEVGETGVFSRETNFDVVVGEREVPVITSPGERGTVRTRRPTIEWTPAKESTEYHLLLKNLSTGEVFADVTGISDTFYRPKSANKLPQGTYEVQVRGLDLAGEATAWSESVVFTVDIREPLTPDVTGPRTNSGTQIPEITWEKARYAKKYRIIIVDRGQDDTEVHRATVNGGNTLSYTPTIRLPESDLTVFVAGINSVGELSDYGSREFSVSVQTPKRPKITGPIVNSNGTIGISKPTYSWTAVANAFRYDLRVENITTGDVIVRERSLKTPTFDSPANLKDNNLYRVTVRARNTAGEYSRFSKALDFETKFEVPTTPTMISPVGEVASRTPVFEFEEVNAVTRYRLFIKDLNTNSTERINIKDWDVNEDGTIASYQLTREQRLRRGTYQAWVQAIGSSSSARSGYSNSVSFTIVSSEGTDTQDLFETSPLHERDVDSAAANDAVIVEAPSEPVSVDESTPTVANSTQVRTVETDVDSVPTDSESAATTVAMVEFGSVDWTHDAVAEVQEGSEGDSDAGTVVEAAAGILALPVIAGRLLKRVRNRKKNTRD